MTTTPDPLSPQGFLALALQEAGIHGYVAEDEGALAVQLLCCSDLPFTLDTAAAQGWLDDAGIRARARSDDESGLAVLVVSPLSDRDARRLGNRLLELGAPTRAVLAQLTAAFSRHALSANVRAGRSQVTITIQDDDPRETAVQLSVLLGADDIAEGVNLHREKGLRKLAMRMRLLLIGLAGEGVTVQAEQGCVHNEDLFTVRLSLEQAQLLAGRLLAIPALPGS